VVGVDALQDSLNIIRLLNKQVPDLRISKSILQRKPAPQHNPVPVKSAIQHPKHLAALTNVLHRLDAQIEPGLPDGKIPSGEVNEAQQASARLSLANQQHRKR
jgi:hypothetical protein